MSMTVTHWYHHQYATGISYHSLISLQGQQSDNAYVTMCMTKVCH